MATFRQSTMRTSFYNMCWLLTIRLISSSFMIVDTTAWTLSSLPPTTTTITSKAKITHDATTFQPITRTIFDRHGQVPSTETSRGRRSSSLALSSSISSNTPTDATEQQQDGTNDKDNIKNQLAQDLFDFANGVGQVGSKTTEENQQTMVELANALMPYSVKAPARVPLVGTHILQYSASPGGSSGQIGPLVGKVEQRFVDDTLFYNVVKFSPLGEVKLLVEREIMDDTRIKVKFVETSFMLFDRFTIKKFPVKGVGVWKQLFVGEVNVTLPGNSAKSKILLRIMEAPSLFIIYQILE